MATKVVILFQSATDPPATGAPNIGYVPRVHTGGWSELLWHASDDPSVVINCLTGVRNAVPPLLLSRANCLPVKDSIIGVRLYAGSTGRGQSFAFAYPGGYLADEIPQMGLLIKCGSVGLLNSRRWIIRGIPDDSVVGGEFAPTPNFIYQIGQLFLAYSNFGFYGNDLTLPVAKLSGVDAGGNATVINPTPQPFMLNDRVHISRAVDVITGLFKQATGFVKAVVPPNVFQIDSWTGNAANGGKATKILPKIFCPINSTTCAVSRVVVRKVGRPFEQYRGRRSRRRKAA